MPRNVIMNWGVSSYFGWGVYGLNLALAWANDPDVALAAALRIDINNFAVDAVRARALAPFLAASARLQSQLEAYRNKAPTVQNPMLVGLDAEFEIRPSLDRDVNLSGTPTIGVTFFETAALAPSAVQRARAFPLIIAGSSWNERVLTSHGVTSVRTILQGVDPSLFHPAPPMRFDDDRFFVFSGGKLEPRKGQDIALVAFRRFAERHSDAVLVASWHSPWPLLARQVDKTGLAAPVTLTSNGKVDATAWAVANGVRPENFLDAGLTPNPLMPQLYRQMDVGLFTNRCEGGTNLVAMECMACGVPAILAANTGHLDLIEEDNCYALTRQGPVTYEPDAVGHGDVEGWGESDVEEAVELLERAYADRAEARARGERGARTLSRLTWQATAAQVKEAVLQACEEAAA